MRIAYIATIANVLLSLVSLDASATCILPNTISNGKIGDASQVMGNFNSLVRCASAPAVGGPNALQYNSGSGILFGMPPLSDGQIPIGTSNGSPQSSTLGAGPQISVTNSAGKILISNTGPNSQFSPPHLSNFTVDHDVPGTTVANTSSGLTITEPYTPQDNNYILWSTSPYSQSSRSETIGVTTSFWGAGYAASSLFLSDSSGKLIRLWIGSSGANVEVGVDYWNNYSSYYGSAISSLIVQGGTGFLKIADDGVNLTFYYGSDLNSLVPIGTLSRTAFLSSGPAKVGLGINAAIPFGGSGPPTSATFIHSSFGG